MTENQSSAPQEGLPSWIAAGVLGLALGAGITVVAMRGMGYARMDHEPAVATQEVTGSARPPTTSGPPGGGMSAGSGGMGGMMGPGGGGGGMGGGGAASPGARAKRTLTSLVGKLDVATKGIQFQLTPEQSAQIVAKVAELQKAEKMPGEAAEKELAALEGILTDEQKATLAAFELPRGGRPGGGGGGPGGGGGGPGGGAPPGPGNVPSPMGMAMMPPDENENPFHQEANQKRAQELLVRLGGAPAEAAAAAVATEPAAPASPATPAADAKPATTEESKTPPADEAKPATPAADKPAADKPAADEAKPATPTPPATETKPPANP